MSIESNFHFRIDGVIADDLKKSFKVSVQFLRYQLNQDFSLAAGRDVRVKPYHFGASIILNFGDMKKGFSQIFNGDTVGDWFGRDQVTDVQDSRIQDHLRGRL
jgi:hypothetical protein